jgi:hypothetical protein
VTATLYPPGTQTPLAPDTPGVVVLSDPQFDVIVVPDLTAGPWRVALSDAGGADVKAIVIQSRIELELLSPGSEAACVGQPWLISARLLLIERGQEAIPLASSEAPETLSAQVTFPDGQTATLMFRDESNNGEYTGWLHDTDQPGSYEVVLRANVGGLDAQRTVQIRTRVCPVLSVIEPRDGETIETKARQEITITAQLVTSQDLPLDRGKVLVSVTGGAANPVTLRLKDVGQGRYRGRFVPRKSGSYEIRAYLEGAVWQGMPVQAQSEPVRVTLQLPAPLPTPTLVLGPTPVSEPVPKRDPGLSVGIALAVGFVVMLALLLRRWARRPRLDGELVFGQPGGRLEYEPIRGQRVYIRVESGYLVAGRRRRGAQALLRVEGPGGALLARVNGGDLTKNNLPVDREGVLVSPSDVIRLAETEFRYQPYEEE